MNGWGPMTSRAEMKRTLRVLYVSHLNELRMGGQRSLAALVAHRDKSLIKAFALCPGEGPLSRHLESNKCRVFNLSYPALTLKNLPVLWKTVRQIRSILKQERIDIVHSDEERATLLCTLAALQLPVRVLWHVRILKRHHLDGFNARYSDALIGISYDTLRRFHNRETLSRKFRVIYNGVDCTVFTPAADVRELRSALGLAPDRFIVLFAGQIKGGKGIADLASAWAVLQRQVGPEAMPLLLYVGTLARDPAVDDVRRIIRENSLEADVRFVEQQSNIHEWMQAADALVLPSHEGFEGMGRVMFEAMACGTVAIGSDISGVREAVTPESGILVPEKSPVDIANAIQRLMNSPEDRKRYVEEGLRRARQVFDIRQHARAVEAYYEDILGL